MGGYEEQISEAMKCAEEGKLSKAESICQEILLDQPGNFEGRHLAAYISILKGEWDEAIKTLLQLIAEKADDPAVYLTLATAYRMKNSADETVACFRRVLQLEPKDVDILQNLAEIYLDQGHIRTASEYAERALDIDPHNPGAIKTHKELNDVLHAQCFGPISKFIPDGIGRGKPQVIFILRQIARLGHLILEPFYLKCLYNPDDYDIIILTLPKQYAASMPVFDLAMRDVFNVEIKENLGSEIFDLSGISIGTHLIEGRTYVLESYTGLRQNLFEKLSDGNYPFRYTLTDEDLEMGQDLRKAMDIPSDARIVTLFVREQGFFAEMLEHSVRNSNVMNYIPAVKFLVDEGYYVVRIGDDKMRPLPDLGPRVVDAPFHPAYTQFVEPYFVAQSAFMMKTMSGPEALSKVFSVPALFLNAPIQYQMGALKNDLLVFKKYYSHRFQRNLSLREIAFDKNLLFSNLAEHFARYQIELLENTEDEILRATEEMVARLKGEYEGNPDLDTRFSEICRQIHEDCAQDTFGNLALGTDLFYFGLHLSGGGISHEFCDSYPEFLS